MQTIWNFLKTSYVLPIGALLVVLLVLAIKKNFSFVDVVAERVIEKMELRYSPYGPENQPIERK